MFSLTSDDALVKKAIHGKADAWDKLIKRYEKKIYNHALRATNNRDDAMDLMQEIFLSVYRNLPKYRGDAPFGAWLFRVASHRTADFYRRRKPTESLADRTDSMSGDGGDPHESLTGSEKNRVIMDLLARLSPEQRQVVEMKYFQELTFDEMSDTLGVSSNTLKSRLYGALKKIKTFPEVSHAL